MDNLLIQRTHYEVVKDLIQNKKIFHQHDFKSFINQIEAYCGINPTYESFWYSPLIQEISFILKNTLQMTVYTNVLYHLYSLYQQHERVYYVCPKLAIDLARTELNVDTHFLKAPFPEIYIQIDPGLYYITDSTGEFPIRGFYVNVREEGEVKLVRIMAAALKSPYSDLTTSNDDSLFYFKIPLGPGKVAEQLQKYIDNSVTDKEHELKKFGGIYNVNHIKELFMFVFNVLLYITSKDADILNQLPMNYGSQISRLKNKSKIAKLLQRQAKTSRLPILIIGSKVISDYSIENIKSAGGVGKWKLSGRVYVSGHWRIQWYGSKDARRSELIFIKPYEKGPEIAEVIGGRQYQVGKS
jgi:hypothetical protein